MDPVQQAQQIAQVASVLDLCREILVKHGQDDKGLSQRKYSTAVNDDMTVAEVIDLLHVAAFSAAPQEQQSTTTGGAENELSALTHRSFKLAEDVAERLQRISSEDQSQPWRNIRQSWHTYLLNDEAKQLGPQLKIHGTELRGIVSSILR